ncbi:MAG: DUF4178 domain-containing protein [Paracoccaceae bacterium]|uniref:DUF4178 domain-containing protein n=1 Tax=Shimia thalassica TaxID=1715693 RepID=UPI0032999C4B
MTGATLRAVNCTSCGAGLDILGGGRVKIQVCPYCGSALDVQKDFRVVAQYRDLTRPETPLNPGDSGIMDGIEFIVIGTIGWVETYNNVSWTWVDHQVFSPTHGYCWITYEDSGHLTVSRKSRRYPNRWLTSVGVETSEQRPAIWLDGTRYAYYETSTAEINFLEGSFNWTPALGQSTTTVTLIAEGEMISLSQNAENTEREVIKSRMMRDDELRSFGLAGQPNSSRHPLATPPRWKHHTFAMGASAAFAAVAGFCAMTYYGNSGNLLASTNSVDLASLPLELNFDVPASANLLTVSLSSNVNNGWAYFDLELEADEDELTQIGGAEVSYYFGRDTDGSWTEGSQRETFSFPAPLEGPHTLWIEMSEVGSGTTGTAQTNTHVTAVVRAQKYSWHPMAVVGILFVGLAGLVSAQEWLRQTALFKGSDWTDDD